MLQNIFRQKKIRCRQFVEITTKKMKIDVLATELRTVFFNHTVGDIEAVVFNSGSRNSHIATLVDRHSRYVMLVKVDGKDT
jgi:IS30 family transposase